MDFKLKLPMKVFWVLMAPFTKAWMGLTMRPTVANRLPADLRPPYLVLSNHVTVYDGLIIVLYLPHLPVVVFDDVQGTDPMKKLLFTNVGVIFKPSGVADPLVIRKMMQARDSGRSLLLYPEGEITWDGDAKPLEMNVARLVRLLGIPVVVAKLKGGYVKQPNWSNYQRSGRCKADYDLVLTPDEIKAKSDEEILKILQKSHFHSEIDWLAGDEGRLFEYNTPVPAKGLEHLLFCCPSCHGTTCMEGLGDTAIRCKLCGYTAGMDSRLTLKPEGASLVFTDMRDWYRWQKSFWKQEVVNRAQSDGAVLEAVCPSVSRMPIKGGKTERIGQGPAFLMKDGIRYSGIDGSEAFLPIDEIKVTHATKFAANKDYKLLVRTKDSFLLFQLVEPNLPVLAWEQAIKALKEVRKERTAEAQ